MEYSFISFDFGKTEPTSKHKEILEVLNAGIKPEAKIKVTGYSDIIGNDKTNLSFSEKRAKAIANSINNQNIEVNAKGESILLYDNNLPEGRMYSRTVITEIETPFVIENK